MTNTTKIKIPEGNKFYLKPKEVFVINKYLPFGIKLEKNNFNSMYFESQQVFTGKRLRSNDNQQTKSLRSKGKRRRMINDDSDSEDENMVSVYDDNEEEEADGANETESYHPEELYDSFKPSSSNKRGIKKKNMITHNHTNNTHNNTNNTQTITNNNYTTTNGVQKSFNEQQQQQQQQQPNQKEGKFYSKKQPKIYQPQDVLPQLQTQQLDRLLSYNQVPIDYYLSTFPKPQMASCPPNQQLIQQTFQQPITNINTNANIQQNQTRYSNNINQPSLSTVINTNNNNTAFKPNKPKSNLPKITPKLKLLTHHERKEKIYFVNLKCSKGFERLLENSLSAIFYDSKHPDWPSLKLIEHKLMKKEYKSIYEFGFDLRKIWSFYFKYYATSPQYYQLTYNMSEYSDNVITELEEMAYIPVATQAKRVECLSMEEKEELGENINLLSQSDLKRLIQLFDNTMMKQDGNKKLFEFDINSLPNETQMKMYRFVKRCLHNQETGQKDYDKEEKIEMERIRKLKVSVYIKLYNTVLIRMI